MFSNKNHNPSATGEKKPSQPTGTTPKAGAETKKKKLRLDIEDVSEELERKISP